MMLEKKPLLFENRELSVSQISNLIKKNVEENFKAVKVKGEISGFKMAPSGHVYFSLKDNFAVISVIIWRGNYSNLKIKPEEGMEVVCGGSITTYPGQSKYQLIANSVSHAGEGALMALLEKRKKQFLSEGLFDQSKKQDIPFLPSRIGVVTSITGAVIKDIIHRIKDRFPSNIVIWPVLVQGEKSANEITRAIKGFNELDKNARPDVIIVARGGGSIEDLWSFNEENVVRAVFNSKIPVISAVGHETDTTLVDYVSDKRAPTPTAAAEMCVPVLKEMSVLVEDKNRRLQIIISNLFKNKYESLKLYSGYLPNLRSVMVNRVQKIDDLSIRIKNAIKMYFALRFNHFKNLRIIKRNPLNLIDINLENLVKISKQSNRAIISFLEKQSYSLNINSSVLKTLSYHNTLKRGFAIVRHGDTGKVIASKSDIGKHKVNIEFKDGKVDIG